MAGIDTNLDDLQSGVEACTRAAQTIQIDAAAVDQQISKLIEHTDLIGVLVRRAKELQMCVLDQSGALRELRQNIDLIRAELQPSSTAQRRSGAGDRRRGNGKDSDRVSSPSRDR
jgi:prefoldin subunit 5